MDRREFCHKVSAVGSSAALASVLQACTRFSGPSVTTVPAPAQPLEPTTLPSATTAAVANTPPGIEPIPATDLPEPTAEPAITPSVEATPESPTTKVALVKTSDRATGIRAALGLLGMENFTGRQVLLKPNFNSADPSPGSTHPDTLRTLLQAIRELGAGDITVADRSGMGNTRNVMEQLGLFDLAAELGFDVAVFDELEEEAWTIIKPEGSHWSTGFAVPKLLLEADCVVQTCNLKTHQYGGHFTMSLKNSVGFAAKQFTASGHNYMSELHSSPYQRHMIAEINSVYRPDLVLLDGIEAFVTGGPAQGKIARSEVILASKDRIAIDAVGVAILRMLGTTPEVSEGPVFAQTQIARAVELGIGVESPSQIEFVTADAAGETYANTIKNILIG